MLFFGAGYPFPKKGANIASFSLNNSSSPKIWKKIPMPITDFWFYFFGMLKVPSSIA